MEEGNMRILFLDCESGGLNSEVNGIYQVAAEYHENGKLVKKFNEKFNGEGLQIDLGALKVNKIRYSSIKSLQSNSVALAKFVDFIQELPPDVCIGGHNPSFDIDFIKGWLRKSGIVGWNSIFSHRVLDTHPLAAFLKEIGAIKVDKLHLNNIAEALKIEVDNSGLHDAEYDVELTAKVYYKIVELGKLLVNTNPMVIIEQLPK